MPVLLLFGSLTHSFYAGVVRYLAEKLPGAEMRKLDGVSHLAPQVAPAPVAVALQEFFAATGRRARATPFRGVSPG